MKWKFAFALFASISLIIPASVFAGAENFDKGKLAFAEGDFHKAVEFFEKALTIDELDSIHRAEVNKLLALIAVGRGNNAKAREYILKVLTHNPGFNPNNHRIFGAPKFVATFQKARLSVDVVSIESSPRGAQVAVDNLNYGQTPCNLVLAGGRSAKITIYAAGSVPYEKEITAIAGGFSSVRAKLRIIPGEINVVATPVGAKILLDGEEIGVAPLKLDDLTPKAYTVALFAEGYKKQEQVVRVKSGKTAEVNVTLELTGTFAPAPKQSTQKFKKDPRRRNRIIGWSLAGVSVASFATSGIFYSRALDYSDKAAKTDDQDDYDQYSSSGETALTITYATAGLGVATGVASGIFLYQGYKDSPSSTALYRPILSAGYDGRKMRLFIGFSW